MPKKPDSLPPISLSSAGELINEFRWLQQRQILPVRIIHKLASMLYEENLRLRLRIAQLENNGASHWQERVSK